MRLKSLFFPGVLLICVAIFIVYIVPDISTVRVANDEKKANEQALRDAQKRKADINAIINQLSSNTDDKEFVTSYLPQSNMEERVIGGINYLTTDAGVALLNIKMAAAPENALANTMPIATNTVGDQSNPNQIVSKMQFNEATVLIAGEYEKIGLFIDKLQKIALFNSIKSFTIKGEEESKLDADKTEATGNISVSKIITAEIVVKFGYLKPDSSDNQIAKIDPKLDNETINALKLYIAGKDVSLISENGEAVGIMGKKNPFFLE